jgi:energy-coupling factor transporter ATP-binding protein EcfA2
MRRWKTSSARAASGSRLASERTHVRSYLATSCFRRRGRNAPVRTLSGGERNRLLLARLFARPANVLVLDEPTNDLDIDTLELLEDLLQHYEGTVFLVSHDRRFLDNVVTSTLVSEGDGRWREYVGDVQDWLTQAARQPAAGVPHRAGQWAQTRWPGRRLPAPKAAASGPAQAQLQGAAGIRGPATAHCRSGERAGEHREPAGRREPVRQRPGSRGSTGDAPDRYRGPMVRGDGTLESLSNG